MTTLQIHTKADAQGVVHLDLPGFMRGSEADLTIIVQSSARENSDSSEGRFSRFSGKLSIDCDPVDFQRAMRDEW